MSPVTLPASIRVLVRGWLNCNQVVLRSAAGNVVLDSGYSTHAAETLSLLAGALDGEPLERLVNTHCHSDHMGGNAAIARAYGCRITIPEGEVKHVKPWTPQSVWMAQFDQRSERFDFDDTVKPGDRFEAGDLAWEAHAAPGHDMDALMFFEPSHRILVSGDALWENGMGFVWPEEGPNPGIDAAHEALDRVARLDPAVVIPGHGEPFVDSATALARVREKLEAFARDPRRNARHVVKVMFVFALLDKGSMPLAEVASYVARVPCYAELSERFLGLDAPRLAQWLVDDLVRSGAILLKGDLLRPAMSA